ncbi:DUF5412 family protein [Priestia aryabhattai]|uniref:DUF5412 family protein n=2 Tax=Priestia aryabhattai TaxID=412384 RepID=UPI0008DE9F75|nr:DUF5412 family protein [Priestia aryabhattai]MBX9969651.1 DUF5412 domain-containing protein [Priestia aryabhattai]MBZ6484156.1 DUF5412 domain-containing protein [Priestia aryabhattai]MDH3115464.1 DUF5412 family protein [Priestia aryabhattai]MDH3125642.1 DUF5412 family protein [Priestia aryabhattai]MDH3134139.1 DUF5412 family protein [Priestia aryabhattai]
MAEKKSPKEKFLFGCLGLILIVVLIVAYLIYYFSFSMNHLPEGELIKKENSPNNTYTIELYRANGGATTSYTLRGEVINNKNKESKNIYWAYDEEKDTVSWKNNHTVTINGHTLDVEKDKYDFRRE